MVTVRRVVLELAVADGTRVRKDSGVRELVVLELARAAEALRTQRTGVRLLAGVDPRVDLQRRRRDELLGADVAAVSPVSGVDTNVRVQVARRLEPHLPQPHTHSHRLF